MNPADHAVEFFPRMLRHIKGPLAGQPFHLDPWQEHEIIRPMFGTFTEHGIRQYRTVWVEVARKNGKSSVASGVGLYCLTDDDEPGGEVYACAADKDQARIVFGASKRMVEKGPLLTLVEKGDLRLLKDAIVYKPTESVFRVLSADAYTKHGLNASAIIFDEVHAQPNRELWDVLTTSVGARVHPLTFAITTAGVWDPESLGWQLHQYAEKVRDGVLDDPTWLPVIYGAEKDDDWMDPDVWAKANPGLGVSIRLDYLEQKAREARETPAAQNTFRRLHLNQWTEQETRWLDMEVWERNAAAPEPSHQAVCYAGLDLASTTDLTALVLLFPHGRESFSIVPHFYIPEARMKQRVQRDRVPYDAWRRSGHIHVTPGEVTDYSFIRRDVNRIARQYQLRELALDRWNATQLAIQLSEEDGINLVEFGQGFASMSAPTKDFERLLLEGKFRHGGHPVLTWNASNVAVKEDAAGNVKPAKDKSTGRIDGIVAAIMATGRAMANDFEQKSVYDRRGVRTL